jgi:subfamily B ATP-binding cassette protein MsbA
MFARRLYQVLRPYQIRMGMGLIAGVVYALMSATLPVAVKLVCDLIFPTAGSPPLEKEISELPEWLQAPLGHILPELSDWKLAIIFSIPVIMLFRGVAGYLNIYFTNWATYRAIIELRTSLFAHLQTLSIEFFTASRTGELMSRITNDSSTLHGLLCQGIPVAFKDPITVGVLVYQLVHKQTELTLISLAVFPLCIVPIAIFGRKVRKSSNAVQALIAETSDIMQEAFTSARVVKAYRLEQFMIERFHHASVRTVHQMMRIIRAMEIPSPLLEFCGSLGVSIMFLVVLRRHDAKFTSGDFLQFVGSIFLLYQPLKAISRLPSQWQQAKSASQRMFELLEEKPTIVEPSNPVPLHAAGKDIVFENLRFGYGDSPAIDNLNLRVGAGEVVALVGSSGSGKTTLTSLLLRFYDPWSGTIQIGGVNLRDVTTANLRDQIAVVTQETILFNDTLRNNIRLGRPGASDAEVAEAARAAQAEGFILEKPGGYDYPVGERGGNLSGGQRQRIAIARAILRNAPILILDEATSALDSESERAVQLALDVLMKGRTTVCIAHRLSTIQHADKIVVMAQGRIVETGRHSELIERNGSYKRLHDLQFTL